MLKWILVVAGWTTVSIVVAYVAEVRMLRLEALDEYQD
jgi:hypothetical protein